MFKRIPKIRQNSTQMLVTFTFRELFIRITASQQKICINFFFLKFIDRIRWPISAFLSTEASKLCDRNTYDKSINLVADMNDFGKRETFDADIRISSL